MAVERFSLGHVEVEMVVEIAGLILVLICCVFGIGPLLECGVAGSISVPKIAGVAGAFGFGAVLAGFRFLVYFQKVGCGALRAAGELYELHTKEDFFP